MLDTSFNHFQITKFLHGRSILTFWISTSKKAVYYSFTLKSLNQCASRSIWSNALQKWLSSIIARPAEMGFQSDTSSMVFFDDELFYFLIYQSTALDFCNFDINIKGYS